MSDATKSKPLDSALWPEIETIPHPSGVPRRPYGKAGVTLSVVGFGGIVVMNTEPEQAGREVARAVERGVNYFDVAPMYGNTQERLGPALEPYRKNVFLACKTTQRGAEGARRELEDSLRLLRTDYFDLYQLHAVTDVEKDVNAVFAKGGAWEVIGEAKKSGRIRHVGFSAHSEEAALRALELYPFDSVLFPINFATVLKGGFGPKVIESARKNGASLLALKAMALEKWPENDPARKQWSKCWYKPIEDPEKASLAIRFALGQSITAFLPPGHSEFLHLALDLAPKAKPLTPIEMDQLRALASGVDPLFRAA